MKLTYDEAADTIIVMLAEADVIDRKEIAPGVYADYDSRGRLISLEALKASEKYDLEGVEPEGLAAYVPAATASAAVGRREVADRLKRSIQKYSRDMGPRTWTRDDLYDRPKRYYQ